MKIQVPRMSAFNSSPQCDFRIIEKVPNFACYTGALICDNSLGVNSNAQVHFMDEIATGQYAFCNLEGIPVALAAITYSEGSPMSHISQAWRQFNPFGYPIYAWLFQHQLQTVSGLVHAHPSKGDSCGSVSTDTSSDTTLVTWELRRT